jgi:N-acetylmuramoyl-L-alanine amidase
MQPTTQPQPAKPPIRRTRPVGAFGTTLAIAILIATLFTAWTPDSLFATNLSEQLRLILTPQMGQDGFVSTPQPQLRIGIVAGHSGNDSGAVCRDETGDVTLTEADVNQKIAALVQQKLNAQGFQVDLLNEFDTRLNGYRAVALVSIHNDSCDFINEQATGFKVSAALNTRDANRASRLIQAVSPPTCASIMPFLKLTRIRLLVSSKPVF